jgi:hypothetical protein
MICQKEGWVPAWRKRESFFPERKFVPAKQGKEGLKSGGIGGKRSKNKEEGE